MRRTVAGVLTAGLAIGLIAYAAPAASAEPARPAGADHSAVVSWIQDAAHPANSLPSGHPPPSLPAIEAITRDAAVVGLGASAEGTRELDGSSQSLARYLVRREGFRSIALEDDWTAGVLLNAYVRTGDGNLRALVAQLAPRFRTPAMLRFVRWVRRYNRAHADDVRFIGMHATSTRRLAYDAVTDYVAAVAPDLLAELRGYYKRIRPDTDDIWAYNDYFYQQVRNKRAYVRLARKAYRLVEHLPVDHDSRDYQLARHNAYTIRAYYTFAALHPRGYSDALMAHNLAWWRQRTGDKVVALSAVVHMAVDPDLHLTYPPRPEHTFKTAGAYLHDRYGDRYVSVGLTFGHGSVTSGMATGHARRYPVPPPRRDHAEHTLGRTHWRCYVLGLDAPAPAAVRAWLGEPARLHVISMGSYDPTRARDPLITGGSLHQWFDALIHTRRVTATHLFSR